ncbi:KPN_02809 family neutral zinc metallopeptidase [Chitinimonas koreensis]|uniref:KPN_02809 family neutral zinc metallopeptidase n=1 Tax=Chitinimonas koreensis TaxID=356302 RepID=UPI0003F95592|nr:neutral zinc metallopeptidase [Chitinimonas koreensis]QNM97321.1 neutral zinc metallopeptidase [Chitinimonas koreensis]
MRLDDEEESRHIEDRRGGGGGLPLGRLGIGGVIAAAALSYFFGVDFRDAQQLVQGVQGMRQEAPAVESGPAKDESARFVSKVLRNTERTWAAQFAKRGGQYQAPTLVLFRQGIDSACGYSSSAVGPFYCPGDQKLYIDLDFLDRLQQELGAQGEFARAYVVAHEVGHHIQKLAGTSDKVHEARQRAGKAKGNQLSVRLELQADCYAGVWGHDAQLQGRLEPGEVEQAIRAAHAIGDDTLQKRAGQAVQPEQFSHGSAEQRARWFMRGMESGDPGSCDTFAAGAI